MKKGELKTLFFFFVTELKIFARSNRTNEGNRETERETQRNSRKKNNLRRQNMNEKTLTPRCGYFFGFRLIHFYGRCSIRLDIIVFHLDASPLRHPVIYKFKSIFLSIIITLNVQLQK